MTGPVGSLHQRLADREGGTRHPPGATGLLLVTVALAWSLFQLWYASPLPFLLDFGILNSTEARSVHLAFALFLAFTAFPALRRSPRDRVPALDWALALAGASAAGYLVLVYDDLAQRPGRPTSMDMAAGLAGLAVLLEAARRAVGPALLAVAALALTYLLAGPFMPDVIAHKGASLATLVDHQWLTTEGVFGVPLGVSVGFIFLFVLFGALLEEAGAGLFFIRLAFSLTGHMRGGPAKAAVLSSAMTGMVSGSSVANVAITGTFTIPLMKRVGFPAEKAGAIEVASSTNGQLTPPVMGAAAFVMTEYLGISYLEVIKHAALPAGIAYIALIYIVHLEAVKAGMQGLPRRGAHGAALVAGALGTFLGLALLAAGAYYGLGWTKEAFGPAASWVAAGAVGLGYLGLVRLAAGEPDPEAGGTDLDAAPPPGATLRSGLHFLLPVAVLIWCLAVERLSPGLSVFWATVLLIAVVLTQRPLKALFRGEGNVAGALRRGGRELLHGLVLGARNMVPIGVATGAAGIIVGTVTATGLSMVMADFVQFLAGDQLLLILLFTAVMSLLLGMGLPTTVNYIIVSGLMAPVIVTLGTAHGLAVPLIAAHLFVFYFGILADDTPPVGLAAYAAAAISGGDGIRTGVQGFIYDLRTAVLPFLFIFNPQLLLIGITGWGHLLLVVASATLGMLMFAAALQGWLLVRCRAWEVAALLLVAFTLFRPGFWMDRAFPPMREMPPQKIQAVAEAQPAGAQLRLRARGTTLEGETVERQVLLPLGPKAPGRERLRRAGLELRTAQGAVVVDSVAWDSPADKAGLDFDWRITAVLVETERPPEELAFLPALVLLGLVYGVQRRRARAKAANSSTGSGRA